MQGELLSRTFTYKTSAKHCCRSLGKLMQLMKPSDSGTRFDPHAQCWHALGGASLPHPRWGSAVALDAEGRLFVCGGYKAGTYVRMSERHGIAVALGA